MRHFFLLLATFAITPISMAFGAFPLPSDDNLPMLQDDLLTGPKSVIDFINVIANWIFVVLITIAVISVLLAAFNYLNSRGGENVEKAHKMLLFAAVAIAVAVLSKGIVFTVRLLVDDSTRPTPSSQIYIYEHTA